MQRNEYIKYRAEGNSLILWEYYNEKYNGSNKLDVNSFMQAMFQYPFKNQAYQAAIQEYDVKYELMTIIDRNTGQIIKYY